jgi:HAD superfamily hydrolase (TIGR01458 family)
VAGLLIDLDGVLYVGDQPVTGAAEAIGWLRSRQIPFLFLTNTTSRPRHAIVERLARLGIDAQPDEILTPCTAAVRWLSEHGCSNLALFVPEATRGEFKTFNTLDALAESGADAVVVGDLGAGWDFHTLNRAFRLLMDTPAPILVALGMTRYWRAEDGLRLDTAPYAVALSHASGIEPVVVGKPAELFFESALGMLGEDAANTYMIGDDIVGDIAGSQAVGLKGLLVRTGKFLPEDLQRGVTPHAVLESIATLPDWWQTTQRNQQTSGA